MLFQSQVRERCALMQYVQRCTSTITQFEQKCDIAFAGNGKTKPAFCPSGSQSRILLQVLSYITSQITNPANECCLYQLHFLEHDYENIADFFFFISGMHKHNDHCEHKDFHINEKCFDNSSRHIQSLKAQCEIYNNTV